MNAKLLLDTSIVIAIFRRDAAAERLVSRGALAFLPAPALGELYYGVPRSRHPELALAQVRAFVDTLQVVGCDAETARIYGGLKHALRTKGRPLPENDTWIAAIAVQHSMTLATRDKHFEQIGGLDVLNA
jgi:tRNA(fMet)-specific endonuclease VapC